MNDYVIRKACVNEFQTLWQHSGTNTYHYFLKLIQKGTVEFWTIEHNNALIAELYIFWDSEDKEEANNKNRAYLCAFRVQKKHQGQGLGSRLMKQVFQRIKENGFDEVTIGIDNEEFQKLSSMYQKWGFTELVKRTNIDLHYNNKENQPTTYKEAYDIYLKKL